MGNISSRFANRVIIWERIMNVILVLVSESEKRCMAYDRLTIFDYQIVPYSALSMVPLYKQCLFGRTTFEIIILSC